VSGHWYDVFANNCQSFVYELLNHITPKSQKEHVVGVAFFLTRLTAVPTMLLTRLYLSIRGCDDETASQYCQMLYLYFWFLWARLFAAVNYFREILGPNLRKPVSVLELLTAFYLASIWIPIYFLHAVMQCPLIKPEPTGSWRIVKSFTTDDEGPAGDARSIQEIERIRRWTVLLVPLFWFAAWRALVNLCRFILYFVRLVVG
jgi:hypothetical protein